MAAVFRALLASLALAAGLAACSGTVRMEAGKPFDPAVLESVLRPGVSGMAEGYRGNRGGGNQADNTHETLLSREAQGIAS